MGQRTCEVDRCSEAHLAKGMCKMHYRRATRNRRSEYFTITCIVCDQRHQHSRRDGKFCSDICKGAYYSSIKRTRSKLPVDHPVMVLIAEARKPKPKPVRTDRRTPRQCPGCACWFCPLHHSAATQMLTCSARCNRRVQKRRYRARKLGATGSWTWAEFMRIARKFDYCCAYCGEKPDRLDADHVVPLTRGGLDSPTNLLPACMLCNSSKCAMYLHEWAAWRTARELEPRVTSWLPSDTRFSHLTDATLISQAA